MSITKLPTGWRVELLGLISAVKFTNGRMELLWCDGEWTTGHGVTARAVPQAATQAEARRVGTTWLASLDA